MQQSPFPIAHSNQGFQGRWTDWNGECDCCRFVIIRVVNTLMCFLYISSTGMDASAQTGSHELTIPNDVSAVYFMFAFFFYCVCKKDVPLLVSLFSCYLYLFLMLSHFSLSHSAHWLHYWTSGRKDQWDSSDVRGSDQDCQPCGGLDWQTGHHHWLPCQYQPGWVSDQCSVRGSVLVQHIHYRAASWQNTAVCDGLLCIWSGKTLWSAVCQLRCDARKHL